MGSRKTHEGAEKVYAAAEFWVDRALRRDDSLFTPGKAIWTRELLGELRERLEGNLEVPGILFLEERLEQLLEGSPPELYQLMGEAMYVAYLIAHESTVGFERKKEEHRNGPLSCLRHQCRYLVTWWEACRQA